MEIVTTKNPFAVHVTFVLFCLTYHTGFNVMGFFLISHRLIKYRSQAPFSYFPVDLLKLMFGLKGQQTKMLNDILHVHVIDSCRSVQTQSHVRLSSYRVPNTTLGSLLKNSEGDWCESLKGGTMAWKTRTYLPCPSVCSQGAIPFKLMSLLPWSMTFSLSFSD